VERLTALESSEFISSRDLDKAQSAIVEYNLRLKELDLLADATRSDIRSSKNRLVQLPALRDARAAEFLVKQHQLSVRIMENEGRNTQRVLAPVDGVVSGLLVRNGQTVSSSRPLLSIIPENGDYYAEVLVPTRTIAFVRPGAAVQIRFDAYPYQKFGTHSGVIESVSRSTVLPTDKRFRINITEPVYLAHVRILQQGVEAYGELLPLQSGMTLTADVLRDQRRLVEWIFDPLVSATRKL
jgi:membrane fusion protein